MYQIPDVLNPEQVSQVKAMLAEGEWADATETTHPRFAGGKHNQQLRRSPGQVTEIDRMIIEALARNELFASVARPSRFLPPLFNRYGEGMQYGRHIDAPILGAGQPLRTDIAVTLFLSEPEGYDGGELVVLTPGGEAEFKLAPGSAAVYPGSTHHWVELVTRGERLAAVTWAQSFIRDPALREILLDLEVAMSRLLHQSPDSEEAALVAKSHANLIRMFSEI